jgi:hypothetical protein
MMTFAGRTNFFNQDYALSVKRSEPMEPMEFDNGKAIVRIHPGKLTDAEFKELLIIGGRRYFAALEKQKKEGAVLVRQL